MPSRRPSRRGPRPSFSTRRRTRRARWSRAEDLERIVHLAHERGIYLLLDECYVYLNYAGKPVSGGSFTWAKEHIVILGSLSKTYAMTGWRAGFALAAKPVVANLSKLQSQSTSNATSFVQKAAIAALAGSQECVTEFRAEFIELRDYMLAKAGRDSRRHLHQARGRVLRLSRTSPRSSARAASRPQPSWPRACCTRRTWSRCPARPSAPAEHIRISYPVTKQNIDEGTRRMGEFLTGLR